jgi:hypothetical protein
MSSGALLQLLAVGGHDAYLSMNPQITFFKVVYKRYTNFAISSQENQFSGPVNFGSTSNCDIQRTGDLISRVTLEVTLPAISENVPTVWPRKVGHALIRSAVIDIGGMQIDKIYAEFLSIWSELSVKPGQQAGYAKMIGDVENLYLTNTIKQLSTDYSFQLPSYRVFVPLPFWFSKNPGLAIPLIALQYHQVKIQIQFRELRDLLIQFEPEATVDDAWLTAFQAKGLVNTTKTKFTFPWEYFDNTVEKFGGVGVTKDRVRKYNMSNSSYQLVNPILYVDYYLLDSEERKSFASNNHEYLMEQLQFNDNENAGGQDKNIKLIFNHPTKYMSFVAQRKAFTDINQTQVFGLQLDENCIPYGNPVRSAKLSLNGSDRWPVDRPGEYFNRKIPFDHFTNVPVDEGINIYSFAINPEDHQPSGSLNYSKIENAQLSLKFNSVQVVSSSGVQDVPIEGVAKVFATNINVVKVGGGMGGLAFAS